MRRWLLILVCLLLAASGAQAAQLISDGSSGIPGAVAPVTATSFTGGSTAMYLLDDDPATCWMRKIAPASGTVDIIFTPANFTVAAIWMRSGNQASQWDYTTFSRPNVIQVTLSYMQGNTLASVSYRYAVTDVYSPDTASPMWNSGYQCLLLPTPVNNVQSVSMTVESTIAGTSATLCISDVLFSDRNPMAAEPSQEESSTGFQPIETTLLMRLATRSGPSTEYEGLGSYFKAGQPVKVLSLTYDNGGTAWVQVEFTYKNRLRRAYTGLKRVDVDEALLPREERLTDAVVLHQLTPRFGPGTAYEARNLTLEAGQYGSVYAYENGWAQFEYFDSSAQLLRRVWVPTEELNIY